MTWYRICRVLFAALLMTSMCVSPAAQAIDHETCGSGVLVTRTSADAAPALQIVLRHPLPRLVGEPFSLDVDVLGVVLSLHLQPMRPPSFLEDPAT